MVLYSLKNMMVKCADGVVYKVKSSLHVTSK